MTRKIAILTALLPVLGLISGCGNDLESRQEAANELQPSERVILEEPRAESTAPAAEPTSFADAEDEDGVDGESETGSEEEADLIVDAAPEDLIDSAQGFSAEPMDDAQGFDPSPSAPENYEN